MKTRVKDFLDATKHVPAYCFQYIDPIAPERGWTYPAVNGNLLTWSTTSRRDRARSCFTHRRSVGAALGDLKRARLAKAGQTT
jgi:hypothetical protein